jgi:uncharacterized DUF497 family protein
MKFEWDKKKNQGNIKKHGFDFNDAISLFSNHALLFITHDSRMEYGEERWKGIGLLNSGCDLHRTGK